MPSHEFCNILYSCLEMEMRCVSSSGTQANFYLVLSCQSHINPLSELSPGFQFVVMADLKPGFYFSVVTMSWVLQKCKDILGKGPKRHETHAEFSVYFNNIFLPPKFFFQ